MSCSFTSIALLTFSSVAGLAIAQPVDLRAPIAGFVYQKGLRSVRPVVGVSGSSRLGAPMADGLDSASVAPNNRWAIVTAGGQTRLLRGLSELSPTESSPQGLIDQVDGVVWNRGGSFAVLQSSSNRQLQRVRLSERDAFPDPPIPISWGEVDSLAIDAAGRQIAISVVGSGLYLWTAGESSPTLLPVIAEPAAFAFDEEGRLYTADAATQRILRFDSESGVAEFTSLAADSSAAHPVGLAVSRGGRYLLLADRTSRSVLVYDIASGSLARAIALDFAPSRFEPLSSEPSFLLNDPGAKEWLMILNAGETPSVSFVPAAPEVAQ
jgi:hypothetical protein